MQTCYALQAAWTSLIAVFTLLGDTLSCYRSQQWMHIYVGNGCLVAQFMQGKAACSAEYNEDSAIRHAHQCVLRPVKLIWFCYAQ